MRNFGAIVWWLLCGATLGWILTTAHTQWRTTQHPLAWQILPEQIPTTINTANPLLSRQLQAVAQAYASGSIPNLEQLAQRIGSLTLIRKALVRRGAHATHLHVQFFEPFASLNDEFYVNRQGEIQRKPSNTSYNPAIALYLPQGQLQQLLPSILQLEISAVEEDLQPQTMHITLSEIWTVSFTNGWTMLFGPNPRFSYLFDQIKHDAIYQRGTPVRFDFRYDAAVAVTYQR